MTLILLDKGYYDYDYERPDERTQIARTAAKSDRELIETLSRMGFGNDDKSRANKPLSLDEKQRLAMAEVIEKKQGNKR